MTQNNHTPLHHDQRPLHSKQTTLLIVDAEATRTVSINTRLLNAIRPIIALSFLILVICVTAIIWLASLNIQKSLQVHDAKREAQHAQQQVTTTSQEISELKNIESQALQAKLDKLKQTEQTVNALQQYLQKRGVDTPALTPQPLSEDVTEQEYNSAQGGADPAGINPISYTGDYPTQVATLLTQARQVPLGRPHTGALSSRFGPRSNPFGKRKVEYHHGLDFRGKQGEPITTTADGVVTTAARQRGYGNVVKVKHGYGYTTVYAHLSRIYVKKGQKVKEGELIGALGSTGRSTGPHLHYEVRYNNTPLDPEQYLNL